jgi:thiol-disulfide isomerase/thioredoxin
MKKWVSSLLLSFLLLSFPHSSLTQPPSIPIYLFYAEDCPSCQAILHSYVPTLKAMYPFLEIKTFDLAHPSHYEALLKLEETFHRKADELPVLFIGDRMLYGEKEIMEKLDPIILDYQVSGSLPPPLPPLEIPSKLEILEKSFTAELTYFYQKGCPKCDRASYLLKYLNKKYPNLRIKEIDLNTPDGKRLNEILSNRLNLPPEKRLIAPALFIGETFLPPEEITELKVEELIKRYSVTSPSVSPTLEDIKKAEESIIQRFKSFGVVAILLAGLIEGLNPCALATLVFFISYLTMVGRTRREILWAGLGFTGAGFVTHLLLGFGILGFVQQFSLFPLLSRIIYWITFLLSLFLGAFSLYDYIQVKKGRPSRMTLQVPNSLKKRIHRIIRTREGELEAARGSQSARFLFAAIGIGFIVTLLQSTCTSQVYLPTILFVTHIPSLRSSALFYLILYNLVYILPLVVIFGIVYWGTTSEQLSFFLQRRTSTIKLLTALFFFVLAGILIFILL